MAISNKNIQEEIVYVIGIDRIPGTYKIGRTKKDVNARMKELSTGQPYTLYKVLIIRTTNAAALETYLHQRYKEKKISREWFDLEYPDIEWLHAKFGINKLYEWT